MREHLSKAEAGEYRSVHVCLFRIDDGTMHRESAGQYNVFEVIAALECTKHGLIANNSESGE